MATPLEISHWLLPVCGKTVLRSSMNFCMKLQFIQKYSWAEQFLVFRTNIGKFDFTEKKFTAKK